MFQRIGNHQKFAQQGENLLTEDREDQDDDQRGQSGGKEPAAPPLCDGASRAGYSRLLKSGHSVSNPHVPNPQHAQAWESAVAASVWRATVARCLR